MFRIVLVISIVSVSLICPSLWADEAAPLPALAKMPVKEVTVFKDGHALLLHQGRMPTDAAGNVLMDYLPSPIFGTFWPYSADKAAKLSCVVAGQRRVAVERTALDLRNLIEANIGAQVMVTESGKIYPATILAVPEQSSEELEATSPPNTGEKLPVKGNIVLFKTEMGIKPVRFEVIQEIAFRGDYKAKNTQEELRNMLTLKLDWTDKKAGQTAEVGLMYVQKGIRWIPEYKVILDGKGGAIIQLQATLINEMLDLQDVTTNLVVGVPTFAFKDTPDPIGLGQTVARLSQHFQADARSRYALSNAMMTQMMADREEKRLASAESGGSAPPDLGPEVASSGKNEDLFVFTVKHLTLKKGQRMVLPVAEFKLEYKDVYVLDIPFAPPPEMRGNLNNQQQAEIAKLMNAPKAMHKIRMVNKSAYPLTTAPALIFLNDKILAQGMMTYTAIGSTADLDVTTAVDIRVKKSDKETRRTPNAVAWNGEQYGKVELSGKINLTNFKKETVELEVTRHVLGTADEADHDGKAEMINVFENEIAYCDNLYPYWWGWYSWPHWWSHFNGIGKFTWKCRLEPDQSVDLGYSWHYFWR